jgi:putative membrane-bound dehydrogenase-like protein
LHPVPLLLEDDAMTSFVRACWLVGCLVLVPFNALVADDLAYLYENNPWAPHADFPKLTTPQWVGEEGVEAVVILGIDDMRDSARYEAYLRPILQRLKQIDGRAPVSIMSCKVDPHDPQLQAWLEEGLSLEVHTFDHPCPLLHDGDLAKAKGTYDKCIDLLNEVPRNRPVAFRTPCCDSLNTVSPRFFAEIFNKTTPQGNFLQCDTSVFNVFTEEAGKGGKDSENRTLKTENSFHKYIPKGLKRGDVVHDNFVNTIENYPYPYVINGLCWEFPCVAPSDWSAQHLHGVNNPDTVRDWKAALDITVQMQGVFCLVFHPHGWIEAEQINDLIDHAVEKHGNKVKFLTFKEAMERINENLLAGHPLRDENGRDNGVRIVDVDRDGYMDVAIGNDRATTTRLWRPEEGNWEETGFPVAISSTAGDEASGEARFGVVNDQLCLLTVHGDDRPSSGAGRAYRFADGSWQADETTERFLLVTLHAPSLPQRIERTAVMFRDVTGDGTSELFITTAFTGEERRVETRVHGWSSEQETWEQFPVSLPSEVAAGLLQTGTRSVRFVSSDGERAAIVHSNPDHEQVYEVDWLDSGHVTPLLPGENAEEDGRRRLPSLRNADGSDNGFFVHSGRLIWQNEQTDTLPDLTIQIPFEDLLAEGATAVSAVPTGDDAAHGSESRGTRPPDNVVRIGAAKVDITPDYPVRLCGYGNRKTESEGVAQRIFARAVVLGDPAAVLVNIETCGFPESFVERVTDKLNERHEIPRERVVLCATHTHSAPWLTGYAPMLFAPPLPEEQVERCRRYEEELFHHVVQVVSEAMANRRPAQLWHAEGEVTFAVNRRRLEEGTWRGFGVQADGPVDHRLPILVAKDLEGKPLAIVSNYACHCTTLGGEFNQVAGDWAGYAQEKIEETFPGAIGMSIIGCGADANPAARGGLEECRRQGEMLAAEVERLMTSELKPIAGSIACRLTHVDLPLGPLPSRESWERRAQEPGVPGAHAQHFLDMLNGGQELPTSVRYPIGVWSFGEDLAMVFLGGEVVVDYAIRLSEMFDSERLWITAYANAIPSYIPSARLLREGGYETDSSMHYYRQPTRYAPEVEETLLAGVTELMPDGFGERGERLNPQRSTLNEDNDNFPPALSPAESLATIQTKPGLKVELVAAEPLVVDPVAFDWGTDGKLWVVEMYDYPNGLAADPEKQHELDSQLEPTGDFKPGGRVKFLEDTTGDGQYDTATLFLDDIPFPTGIHCWRDGVLVTAAPEIFYAEDTTGDGKADVKLTLYRGFGEGNQQHRVNGLRWGLDNWVYVGNGDSGGEIVSLSGVLWDGKRGRGAEGKRGEEGPPTEDYPLGPASPRPLFRASGIGDRVNVSGRDLRIWPDTGHMQSISGQTQFGRERDDWGNWFGNNNSRPLFHYVLDDTYLRRNPHLAVRSTWVEVPEIPGAAPVYPISRTLARFNDFDKANRFTSACSTIIFRDTFLGEEYFGNAFTCEPVHNLVSRLIVEPQGATFRGRRAEDERDSEFLASTDNWFRPVMVRTGPDGGLWVADMYRFVIEHPKWIPDEWKAKLHIRAGDDMGRIYRIVPDAGPVFNPSEPSRWISDVDPNADPKDGRVGNRSYREIPLERLVASLDSPNGWQRDTAQRLLIHRFANGENQELPGLLVELLRSAQRPQTRLHTLCTLEGIEALKPEHVRLALDDEHPGVLRHGVRLAEGFLLNEQVRSALAPRAEDEDPFVRMQLAYSLGEVPPDADDAVHAWSGELLGQLALRHADETHLRTAVLSSLNAKNVGTVFTVVADAKHEDLLVEVVNHLAALVDEPGLATFLRELVQTPEQETVPAWRLSATARMLEALRRRRIDWRKLKDERGDTVDLASMADSATAAALNADLPDSARVAAVSLIGTIGSPFRSAAHIDDDSHAEKAPARLEELLSPRQPQVIQSAAVAAVAQSGDERVPERLLPHWDRLTPIVRGQILEVLLSRDAWIDALLDALESGHIQPVAIEATRRERLLGHDSETIRNRAEKLLGGAVSSDREQVLADHRDVLELEGDRQRGRAVFEKRCATCHQLEGIGRVIGADLAAVKDKSPAALLTAILDPNRAVDARYLSYAVATTDGRVSSGMLASETANSITLVSAEGREQSILRSEIEEIRSSNKSFMPEGLEKDLSKQDLADVMAFVAAAAVPPKQFTGNRPTTVHPNAERMLLLSARNAAIYGPSLVYEAEYRNLGYWQSAEDYATWTVNVPRAGRYAVRIQYACHDADAGGTLLLKAGESSTQFQVTGTGGWEHYRPADVGELHLPEGTSTILARSAGEVESALIDLHSVTLTPVD